MSTAYYSSFYPAEDSGAKGSAAFVGSIATTIVYLYRRSATALVDADKPNGNVVYTFATADTDVSAVTNGWSVTIPAGTNTLYVTAATAYASNTNTVGVDPTTTILPAQWATPVASTTNSLNGVTARSVFLFKRQATDTTAPTVPAVSTTYTFSNSTLTGTLNGWTQAAPDSDLGKYLYATVATALGTGTTDTILTSEWKSPVVFSEDGAGYTAYLTNEAHTLVAATDGTVSAYTGATGSFVILRDGTDVSASFALSSFSNPQGLGNGANSIYSGNTYTITSGFDTSEDVATLTIRATGSGAHSGITLDKVFTLSKSKSGATAKLLSIYPSRQIVSFDGAGNLLPATGQDITYTAVKQNTTATVNWTIKDNKGNNITPTTSYLSAATGDSVTMTAAQFNNAIAVNSATGVVVTATCDGLTDTTTVVKVVNGTDGIDGVDGTSPLVYDIITSSPVIVKDAPDAATAGTYSSITIQGRRYDGNNTTNYGWVTVTANGDTEATTATNTATTPVTLSPASSSGKSSYTIKLYNQATVSGATLLDTQTITVVFKGAAGSNGTNARAVSLTASTQAFAYDSTGANPSPANTVVTATALNTTGTVYYEFVLDGTSVQNTTTNTYTYTPRAAFGDMPDTLRVNIREGGTATTILASDMIAMTGLKNTVNGTNGINALTSILSNAAHTLPTTNTGTVTYTGSGTTIRLYEGTTELVYDGIGTANSSWKVVATGTNITPGGLTDSGNFVTIADHSAMTASNASVSYAITGKRADGTAISITLVQSLSKSIQGSDGSNGTNARAVSLTANVQAFAYDSAGANPSPANTTVTATALNTTGTVYYEFILDGTSVQNTTTNTYTYTPQASFSNMPDTVRVNIREGGTGTTILASDMIAMSGLKNTTNGTDGLSALTAIMSNSAHTLPTTNAGVVTYTGSGTTIRLYEGTTELAYDGVGTANGSWKVTATPTNITVGTLTDSGTFLTVGQHSAMTANNATISFLIEGKRANGSAISITLVQSLSKSIQGDNGTNGTSAIAAIVSNEAHVFPANSSGAVTSYVGSGTVIRLYEGATELAYDGVGTANGTWTVSAAATNITVGTLTDSGNFVTVGQHSGVANGTDTSSITYTITGKTSTGQSINVTKTQTFSKSKTGTAGADGAAAVNIVLTKEASTILAYADGTLAVAANTITGVAKLFLGTAEISPGAGAGQVAWSITSTAGSSATINTADGTYTLTGLNGDTSSATLTITGTYNGSPYTKSFTVTKTFAGYERRTSDPTTGNFEGRVYYNTSTQKLRLYTGGAWTDKTGTAATTTVIADVVNAGSITSAQLATTELITVSAQIKDAIITNAKIGDLEVDSLKIAGNAVTTGKLGLNSTTSLYNTQPADINLPTYGTTEIAKIENVYSSSESKQIALVESTYTGTGTSSFSVNLESKKLYASGYNRAYVTFSGINTINYNSSGKAPSPSGTTTITASVFNVTSPTYEWYLNGELTSQTTNIFTYTIPPTSTDLPAELLLVVRDTSGIAVVKAVDYIYPLLTNTNDITIVPNKKGAFIPEITGTAVKTITSVTSTTTANTINSVSGGTLTSTNAEYGFLTIQNSSTAYGMGDAIKFASTVAGFTGGTTYYIASVGSYLGTYYVSLATSYSNAINGMIQYPTTTNTGLSVAINGGFFISSGVAITNGTAIKFVGNPWGGISTTTTYYAKNVTSSTMQLSINSNLSDTVSISTGSGSLDIYHFPGGTPAISYAETDNAIRVYKGSTLMTYSTTSPQPANTWKMVYTDINGTTSGGITPGTLSVASNVVTLADVTAGTTGEKYNEINYAITVNDGTTIRTIPFTYFITHTILGSYSDTVNYTTVSEFLSTMYYSASAGATSIILSDVIWTLQAGTILKTSSGTTIGTISSTQVLWTGGSYSEPYATQVYFTSGIPSALSAGASVYIETIGEGPVQQWRTVDSKEIVQLVQSTSTNVYKVRVPATLIDTPTPGYADYRVRVVSSTQGAASSTKTFLSLQGVKKVT